jgi:hypothetical protein
VNKGKLFKMMEHLSDETELEICIPSEITGLDYGSDHEIDEDKTGIVHGSDPVEFVLVPGEFKCSHA